MANSGYERYGHKAMQLFIKNFADYDYIVAPSGSYVYHVRKHYDILEQTHAVKKVRERTLDICEFLVNHSSTEGLSSYFPHKMGLHQSCHGQRGLRFAKSSELVAEPFSIVCHLLKKGMDLRYIQTLLGHNSSKTTEIYTHTSSKALGEIKSPLDSINLKKKAGFKS